MDDFVERTWTSADGLSLFARDYAGAVGPARTPVICIHGLTRNARDFEVVALKLAEQTGRRILAIDVRGRGRSDRDPNPMNYNPMIYAGDVIALTGQAGIARAVFVGTSMGGLITMMLAASRGDLIAGAVLNDVGPEVGAAGLARISLGLPWAAARPVEGDLGRGGGLYQGAINGCGACGPYVSEDVGCGFARRTFRETGGKIEADYDPAIAEAIKATPPPAPDAPQPTLWPLFTALATGRPLLVVRGVGIRHPRGRHGRQDGRGPRRTCRPSRSPASATPRPWRSRRRGEVGWVFGRRRRRRFRQSSRRFRNRYPSEMVRLAWPPCPPGD